MWTGDLTPTVSLIEAVWTAIALFGAWHCVRRWRDYHRAHARLVRIGVNGGLRMTMRQARELFGCLAVITVGCLTIGVFAMTQPPYVLPADMDESTRLLTLLSVGIFLEIEIMAVLAGRMYDYYQHAIASLIAVHENQPPDVLGYALGQT